MIVSDFEPKISLATSLIRLSTMSTIQMQEVFPQSLDSLLTHFETYNQIQFKNGEIAESGHAFEFDTFMNSDFCRSVGRSKIRQALINGLDFCSSAGRTR